MAIKNLKLGGTDFNDEKVTDYDLNDTFDATVTFMNTSCAVVNRIATNSDYSDANDLMMMLSSTVWLAYDDSAKKIYKTIDSGSNWTEELAATTNTMTGFYVNSNDTDYITLFGKDFGDKAFYSDDAGDSWTEITKQGDADQDDNAFSITDSGRIYCIQSDGGVPEVFYSDNAGVAWTQLNAITNGDYLDDNVSIASPVNGVVAYCGEAGAGSFTGYTIDGGANWIETTSGASGEPGILTCLYIDSSNYAINVTCEVTGTVGCSVFVWKGTTYRSDVDDYWLVTLLRFDSTHFIYSSGSNTIVYTSSSYTVLPLVGGFSTTSWQLHGVSATSGEDRLFTSPIYGGSSGAAPYQYTQENIYTFNYYLR